MLSSFVQIRGSIPLLWSQIPNVKYKPPTRMSPVAATEPAFDAHVSDLLQSYKVPSRRWALWHSTAQHSLVEHDTALDPLLLYIPSNRAFRQRQTAYSMKAG